MLIGKAGALQGATFEMDHSRWFDDVRVTSAFHKSGGAAAIVALH